jgi:transposase
VAAGTAAVIRVDVIWLASEPVDMRAGMDTLLARVVKVFGAAQAHQAYCFTNRRATRLKVLMHDGIGVWVAGRRLNRGKFIWATPGMSNQLAIDAEQMRALVLGLPWQRVGSQGAITVL